MWLFDLSDLAAGFRKYFEIVPALNNELREHAYRIRHQVYCRDLKFEPERPDGRESDEYDAHSVHCLIRSIRDDEFVGCTRIVLARPGDPHYPLPFEKTCAETLDRSIADPQAYPRHAIAEVSRLAVVSAYRRRRGERRLPGTITDKSFGTSSQPRFPYIPVALYLGTIELASLYGIETLFMLTERRLITHFSRLGVNVVPIGSAIEHRGTRVPSMMSVSSIIAGFNFVVRPLYRFIAGEIRRSVEEQRRIEKVS